MYGLTTNISWRGFDLSCLLQGAARVSLPVGGSLVHPFDQQGSVSELLYNDHWTPSNTDALYPRVYTQPQGRNTWYSSWWCRDASYLKLRNIELGYTLPLKASTLVGIESLRVYLAGQNLWTWTPNMKEEIDPEAASSNGQYYFQQKVISFGMNLTF
ncbi:MAG: hypothetical protein HC819_24085 [Cyclobacteriaceae bacterium]|nr:hypothetical protein [Cyclobacteriaceae bacterium]